MLLAILPSAGFVSCVVDKDAECDIENEIKDPETSILVFDIGVIGNTSTRAEDGTLINSLRVVILDESGKVEINDRIKIDTPSDEEQLLYIVKVGQKKVFLIGNAENTPLYVQPEATDGTDGPEETAQATTLSEFLSQFPVGSSGFEDAVNNIYFSNQFIEAAGPQTVPLTSVYDIMARPGGEQKFQFWLVRAATKYTVFFTNRREADVYIRELSISSPETQMYLMPQVGTREMNGIYWIDWLRQVADESKDHINDNTDWNGNRGWILDYDVPFRSQKYTFTPVQTDSNEDRFKIGKLTTEVGSNETTPGTLTLGPFYSTEGKNLVDPDDQAGPQSYTLNIKLHDVKDGRDVELSRVLPTLAALFRNTHVLIYVEFDEAWMHVYGEIGKWDINPTAFGSANPE